MSEDKKIKATRWRNPHTNFLFQYWTKLSVVYDDGLKLLTRISTTYNKNIRNKFKNKKLEMKIIIESKRASI